MDNFLMHAVVIPTFLGIISYLVIKSTSAGY